MGRVRLILASTLTGVGGVAVLTGSFLAASWPGLVVAVGVGLVVAGLNIDVDR